MKKLNFFLTYLVISLLIASCSGNRNNNGNNSDNSNNRIITITLNVKTNAQGNVEFVNGSHGSGRRCFSDSYITDMITVPQGKYWILKSAKTTEIGRSLTWEGFPELWDYTGLYQSEYNDCFSTAKGHPSYTSRAIYLGDQHGSMIMTAGKKFKLSMNITRNYEKNMEVQFIEINE